MRGPNNEKNVRKCMFGSSEVKKEVVEKWRCYKIGKCCKGGEIDYETKIRDIEHVEKLVFKYK